MVGNSASKPLNSIPNELPCITVEWWRIAWKKLYAFSRYTAFTISISKYLYKTPFGKSGHNLCLKTDIEVAETFFLG